MPPVRFFPDAAAIVAIGEGLLAATLPRVAWLIRNRPDIDLDIATIIRRYNVASGGVNDDTQGYHDTITRTYITSIRVVLKQRASTEPLVDAVNALLSAPCGTRDWPLRFYTRERLLSVEARRAYMAPDLTT